MRPLATANGYNLVTKSTKYNGLYFYAHNIYTPRDRLAKMWACSKKRPVYGANLLSKGGFTKRFFADIIYIT